MNSRDKSGIRFSESYIHDMATRCTVAARGSAKSTITADSIMEASKKLLECTPQPSFKDVILVDDCAAFAGKAFKYVTRDTRVTVIGFDEYRSLKKEARRPSLSLLEHFQGVPIKYISDMASEDLKRLIHNLQACAHTRMMLNALKDAAEGFKSFGEACKTYGEPAEPVSGDKRKQFKPKTQKWTAGGKRRQW